MKPARARFGIGGTGRLPQRLMLFSSNQLFLIFVSPNSELNFSELLLELIMQFHVAQRTEAFQESVIRKMTRVCQQYKGINLAQGFPEKDPPEEVVQEALRAIQQAEIGNRPEWRSVSGFKRRGLPRPIVVMAITAIGKET